MSNKTIDWNDFMSGISQFNNNNLNSKEITNILCPKCGEKLYKLTNLVYTSYPPKYRYVCEKCNWEGYA